MALVINKNPPGVEHPKWLGRRGSPLPLWGQGWGRSHRLLLRHLMTCRLSGLHLRLAGLPVLSDVKNRTEKKVFDQQEWSTGIIQLSLFILTERWHEHECLLQVKSTSNKILPRLNNNVLKHHRAVLINQVNLIFYHLKNNKIKVFNMYI